MERSMEEFLRRFGEDYGYPNAPKNVEEIRASEFKRLQGLVYLDHAGATLYSEAQMEAVVKDLTSNVYGNPRIQDPKEHNIGYALDKGATALAVDIEDVKFHGLQDGTNESSVRILKHSVQRRAEAKFPQDGVGCKLSEAARILTKTYFSGGTVSASIADIDFIKRRERIEQVLEDGTLSFLAIASIRHGFNIIDTLTTSAISRHTSSLATYVRNMMMDLKHENGANVCTIYGRDIAKISSLDLGPTITFNLRRADGSWYGYHEVENLASLSGIQLRTGCFCNPGACAKYLGLSHSDLISNYEAGHVCWDDRDVLHGKPTGAVRISFGYMSTFEDAEKFLRFLEISFVAKHKSSNGKSQLSTEAVPLSGKFSSVFSNLFSLTW
ncbi:hypothetical protein COCNU_02G018540 [Cocos nucifera]|uniref:Molybdenum cofactor sulfurase n=1 Tax=Cocos nucifera TaxID=13894 RepID=A0A8K0I0Z0_COCNU|nr:hypothetical protein COCNU_02G018540 [Cocos nucifera]